MSGAWQETKNESVREEIKNKFKKDIWHEKVKWRGNKR